MDHDTDTLLALVSSLLTGQVPNNDIVLNALTECNGDVEAAAHLLNKSNKRKRTMNLDDWLLRDSNTVQKSADLCSDEGTRRQRNPIKPSSHTLKAKSSTDAPVDLLSVLRSPPSSGKLIPQLPPLTLSNPTMVKKNTPCTLHLSILPPELACRLFYTMIHASRNWQRNKWWLFEKVVESPHRTAFFARKDDGIDGDESWQQAAQFW
jgi:hypothetical protein